MEGPEVRSVTHTQCRLDAFVCSRRTHRRIWLPGLSEFSFGGSRCKCKPSLNRLHRRTRLPETLTTPNGGSSPSLFLFLLFLPFLLVLSFRFLLSFSSFLSFPASPCCLWWWWSFNGMHHVHMESIRVMFFFMQTRITQLRNDNHTYDIQTKNISDRNHHVISGSSFSEIPKVSLFSALGVSKFYFSGAIRWEHEHHRKIFSPIFLCLCLRKNFDYP